MIFNKVVVADPAKLEGWAIKEINGMADQGVTLYDDIPASENELIQRIGDADCLLVSWQTRVSSDVLAQCPNLKYIGMCCTLYDRASSNVDIGYAERQGIVVKGVRDYGDHGTIEYIISELVQLNKGLGKLKRKGGPSELTGKRIGVIGLGATGLMLARRAMAFGMAPCYYSRTRKPYAEAQGIDYMPLPLLLNEADVVSLHLPKNTIVLDSGAFEAFGNGKVLVNTSMGFTFDKAAFLAWVRRDDNFAIMDGCGVGAHMDVLKGYERAITTEVVSGMTNEAEGRLSTKVLQNIYSYAQSISQPFVG